MMIQNNNNLNFYERSFIPEKAGKRDNAKINEEQIPVILTSVKVFIASINHTPERGSEDRAQEAVEPHPSFMYKQITNSFTRKSALDNNDLNGFSKDPINIKVLVRNIFYSVTHFFTGYNLSGKDFRSGFNKLTTQMTEWTRADISPAMNEISSKIDSIIKAVFELNEFKERFDRKDRILRFTLIATIALTIGGKLFQNKMLKIAGLVVAIGVLFFKTIHYIYMNVKFGVLLNKVQIDINSASNSFENSKHKRSIRLDNKNGSKFDVSKSLPDYYTSSQLNTIEKKEEKIFDREFHSTNFQNNLNNNNTLSGTSRNNHSNKVSKRMFYSTDERSSTNYGSRNTQNSTNYSSGASGN